MIALIRILAPTFNASSDDWLKTSGIGPPPTDEKHCTFLTVDSATPYVAQYDGADAGKMAHYMMRWRMRDGSTGAWSETISATITG